MLADFAPNASPLTRIVLHGALAEQFGAHFTLGVSTPANGLRALMTMVPGFRRALEAGDYTVLRGQLNTGMELDTVSLHLRLPPNSEVHLIPSGVGGKGGGFAKVIIGVALVAAAFAFAPAAVAAYGDVAAGGYAASGGLGAIAFGGISYGQIAIAGGLAILAGVTSLLSPQPKKPYDGSNTQSFLLGGQLNTAHEGVCVPVVYGRMLVGSVTVSSGFYAEDYNHSTTAQQAANAGKLGTPTSKIGTPNASTSNTYVAAVIPTGAGGGGGKSGGGSGGVGKEDPNTLRSKALVRIIDVISEGPISGLVNGARSIYFNGTPLMAADGTYNFQGVTFEGRVGLPDQDPVAGFSAAEETVPLGGGSGIEVKAANGPHTEFISEAGANGATAIRLIVQLPALYQINSKDGSINYGPTLQYKFEIQPVGGAWTTVVNETINGGKCMAPYQRAYRVPLPPSTQGWSVRMTRITGDSNSSSVVNGTFWFGYVLITDHALIYPDTAYMALTIDAESFGSQVPSRSYEIYGVQVAVPANYDATTHTYRTSGPGTSGGTWDLVSTVPSTTDDPCWNTLDMLSNNRYGMGIRAAALESSRADLYVISQYASTLITDGFGGTEPRYTMNAVMATQTDAFSAMQSMVSSFRGMVHWGAGRLVITADMPKGIAKVVNQTNVIDGNFTYEGTSLKTRHTTYRVTWRDPANLYVPTIEVVEDIEQVAQRTEIVADIVAFGCTSRGLAHRLARWALYTERAATETVSYQAGLYHLDLMPGEIIAQTDPHYFGTRLGGRITQVVNNQVTLDSVFIPDPKQYYEIYLVMPTGATLLLHTLGIDNTGPLSVVTVVEAMTGGPPQVGSEFILLGSASYPRQFQVLAVAEPSRAQFAVTALIHDPTKFDWIETGTTLALPTYYNANLPALTVEPMPVVSNVTATAYIIGLGSTTRQRVSVSFTPVADIRVKSYQAAAQAAVAGNGVLAMISGQATPIDIDDLQPGSYTFSVRTVGRDGRAGAWVSSAPVVLTGQSVAPDAATNLVAVGGTRRVQLTWDPPVQSTVYYYEVWRASTNDGTAPGAGATRLGNAGGTTYTDSDTVHLLPNTTWWYWVRAVNTTGVIGPYAGPSAATTTLLIADDLAQGIIDTAKFANGLTPVTLIPDLSTPGTIDGQIAVNMSDSKLYRWSQATHSWMPVVNAADISGKILAGQIANVDAVTIQGQLSSNQINSLDGAKLTGTVTASALTAGSVLASSLTVGSGQNVIWNSCCTTTTDGWALGISSDIFPPAVRFDIASVITGNLTYVLSGFGTGAFTDDANFAYPSASPEGGSHLTVDWLPNAGVAGVAMSGNVAIEAQALLGLHRCCGVISIIFLDYLGHEISRVQSPRYAGQGGGNLDPEYMQAWVHGVSPATTATVLFRITIYTDGGTDIAGPPGQNPYCFFTKTGLGYSVPNSSQRAPWQPGGVTDLTGGMLRTGTVTARNMAVGSITAQSLAVGSVTAQSIAAQSISTDKFVANSVTTAVIAAGAITAAQIRVGEIRSTLLASDFQLTQSSQIGTAVIGTAQIQDAAINNAKIGTLAVQSANIQDLTVGTQKVANNAITNIAVAQGTCPSINANPPLNVTFTLAYPSQITCIVSTTGPPQYFTGSNNTGSFQTNALTLHRGTDLGGAVLATGVTNIFFVELLAAGTYAYCLNSITSGQATIITFINMK